MGQLVCACFLAFLIGVALPGSDRTLRCADRALLLLLSVFTAGLCMLTQLTPCAVAPGALPQNFAGPTLSLAGWPYVCMQQ